MTLSPTPWGASLVHFVADGVVLKITTPTLLPNLPAEDYTFSSPLETTGWLRHKRSRYFDDDLCAQPMAQLQKKVGHYLPFDLAAI